MIHVAFCVHDEGNYICHTATTIASIFVNTTSSVTVHIIHDNTLDVENRDKLDGLAKAYGQKIEYYLVDSNFFMAIVAKLKHAVKKKSFSVGTLFRLKIADILQIHKVIYLDSDIVVNMDMKSLWEIELGNHLIAAVRDLKATRNKWSNRWHFRNMGISDEYYFNAGVIVFNLDLIRKKIDLWEESLDFLLKYSKDAIFFDQDVLNGLFQKKALILPKKYNFIPVALTPGKYDDDLQAIIHFAGPKPWAFRCSQFDWLYWKFFSKTPWCKSISQLLAKQREVGIDLGYALYSGKIMSRRMFIKGIGYIFANIKSVFG